MAIPKSDQTVHLLNFWNVLCLNWKMDGRNVRELALYTTDDLRRLYQASDDNPVRLRDGVVSRAELVAVIRWRIYLARFSYLVLLSVSLVAAVAGVIAAAESWKS